MLCWGGAAGCSPLQSVGGEEPGKQLWVNAGAVTESIMLPLSKCDAQFALLWSVVV